MSVSVRDMFAIIWPPVFRKYTFPTVAFGPTLLTVRLRYNLTPGTKLRNLSYFEIIHEYILVFSVTDSGCFIHI